MGDDGTIVYAPHALTFAPPLAALPTSLTHCSKLACIEAVEQICPIACDTVSSYVCTCAQWSESGNETRASVSLAYRNRHGFGWMVFRSWPPGVLGSGVGGDVSGAGNARGAQWMNDASLSASPGGCGIAMAC